MDGCSFLLVLISFYRFLASLKCLIHSNDLACPKARLLKASFSILCISATVLKQNIMKILSHKSAIWTYTEMQECSVKSITKTWKRTHLCSWQT